MTTPRNDLIKRLNDPEFAKIFGEEDAACSIGILLTKTRKNLGLTQERLANRLGVSQPYIAKLERGEANPSIRTIGRILAVIGFRLVANVTTLVSEVAQAETALAASKPEEISGSAYAANNFNIINRGKVNINIINVNTGLPAYYFPEQTLTAEIPSVFPDYTLEPRQAIGPGQVNVNDSMIIWSRQDNEDKNLVTQII
jgi:transcriptional regulator with XRE-family HTH domain